MKGSDLEELLGKAKKSVRILGIVPLDLEWDELVDSWEATMRKSPDFTVSIMVESDNMLFSKSFTSDTDFSRERRGFRELKFVRDRLLEAYEPIRIQREKHKKAGDEPRTPLETNLSVRVMHLTIPVSLVQVDGQSYMNLWLDELDDEYIQVKDGDPLASRLESYVSCYFDDRLGAKYAAEDNKEILELFDHERIPRGIYPRDSFYDTDYSQLVVWGLIFDRQGRLLIHRRDRNAKDNRNMWDKSVGGHVDFSLDVDTSRAVIRELIEELFSDERKGGLRAWTPTDDAMVYLGEWRPRQRKRRPMQEVSTLESEWAYFRLPNSQQVYSPRHLPNGLEYRLRVIADVFVFVASQDLNDEMLGKLKNSKYKLVGLPELKSAMDKSMRGEPLSGFNPDEDVNPEVIFTPDLTSIMTGNLRDTLEEFSQYVKRYGATRE